MQCTQREKELLEEIEKKLQERKEKENEKEIEEVACLYIILISILNLLKNTV